MDQSIEAIYEDGVLKPLVPLPLEEHQRVALTLSLPQAEDRGWLDVELLAQAEAHADDGVTLEMVRSALASLSGKLSDTVIEDREDR
jgi:predicted DNA-binding antitoxin AbrB/MazE fold protein